MASINYRRIVDLSQEISPETQMFPAYPQPAFLQWTTREHHGFLTEAMFMVTHTATHVDAPWHYRPEGKRIHQFPANRFIARCHILDLRPKRAKGRIGPAEVQRAVRASTFRTGDGLVLRTGWEEARGADRYLFENPGLDRGGAAALVRNRPSLVGIDTANIDLPMASDFPAHHVLLRAEIPILENLANLGAIRAAAFTLVALPLRLRGAGGSPIRAVALV